MGEGIGRQGGQGGFVGEHPTLADIPEQARYRVLKGQSRSSQRRDRKQENKKTRKVLSTQAITQVFFQEQAAGVKDAIATKKSLVHNGRNQGY